MKPALKLILMVILFLTSIFGFEQLSFESDAFAKSLVLCCNAGYCDGAPCSSPASIRMSNPCRDYIVDCYTCMDFKDAAAACGGNAGEYCLDGEGNPYYGNKK